MRIELHHLYEPNQSSYSSDMRPVSIFPQILITYTFLKREISIKMKAEYENSSSSLLSAYVLSTLADTCDR